MPDQIKREYLSDSEVASQRGVSRQTIWRWVARGLFPQPVKLGPNTTRWSRAELDAFEAARLDGRGKAA